jgi:hypothetical protein
MFLDMQLAEALGALSTARAQEQQWLQQHQDGRQLGGGREGQRQESAAAKEDPRRQQEGEEGGNGQEPGDAAGKGASAAAYHTRVRALLAASFARAAAVDWTRQGLQEHEPLEGPLEAENWPEGEAPLLGGASSPLPAAAAERAPEDPRAPAAAAAAAAAVTSTAGAQDAEASGEAGSGNGGSCAAAAASGGGAGVEGAPGEPGPAELDDLIEALLDCSCVVAMHADAATEPAIRLALLLGRPFAVVPCCIYGAHFPRRRLASGARVGTHAQLVQYIVEAAATAGRAAEVVELPFEGKNLCITCPAAGGTAAAGLVGVAGPAAPQQAAL